MYKKNTYPTKRHKIFIGTHLNLNFRQNFCSLPHPFALRYLGIEKLTFRNENESADEEDKAGLATFDLMHFN